MAQAHLASAFKLAVTNLKIFSFENACMNVMLICSFFHNVSDFTGVSVFIVKFLTYESDIHASAYIVKFFTNVTDNFIIFICEKFRNLCEFFHKITFFHSWIFSQDYIFSFVNFFTGLHFFICEFFHRFTFFHLWKPSHMKLITTLIYICEGFHIWNW